MRILRFAAAIIVSMMIVFSASAQEDDIPPILQILALVPDTARQGYVGYSDVRAAEQTRPGAAQPENYAEYLRLREERDPSASLWLDAFPPSGFGFVGYVLQEGGTMPEAIGFDLLDIDRAVTFGDAPSIANIYTGNFDEEAIDNALTGQDFTKEELGGHALWCGDEGCEEGLTSDVLAPNPSNPFGGALGRQQPIVLAGDFIYSAGDIKVVEAITERVNDEKRSLAEVPEYQTAVKAMTDNQNTLLRQAYFIHPLQVNRTSIGWEFVYLALNNLEYHEMPEDREEARAEAREQFGELAPYRLVALADYADANHQYGSVIVVYESAADAAEALDIIRQRIEISPLMPARQTLAEVFDSYEAELLPTIIEDEVTGLAAAVFVWRYDQLSVEPKMGIYEQPGRIYRLFRSMIETRDTMWLAYDFQ
jgi:hypothetical protein